MSLLLHLSDTHFGTEQAAVTEALLALTQQQRPELLVLSGDITQRARPAQFRAARDFMTRLNTPFVAIPGNHDIPLFNLWARYHRPYAGHVAAFGETLEPVHDGPSWKVVCVNTTRAWRHKHGEVSDLQIERVSAHLSQASAEQLRVVVVHQPVAVTRPEDQVNLLRGRTAALERWAEAGADLILGGHIHLPFVASLPGLARPVWAVQAGTAVSSRVRKGAPNSVNLLRWMNTSDKLLCRVEQWDYSADLHAFVCAQVSELQPHRR